MLVQLVNSVLVLVVGWRRFLYGPGGAACSTTGAVGCAGCR